MDPNKQIMARVAEKPMGSSVLEWNVSKVNHSYKGFYNTVEFDESSVHSKVVSTLYCRSICADFRRPVAASYPELAVQYNSTVRFPVDLGTLLFRCVIKEDSIDDTLASKLHTTRHVDPHTGNVRVVAGNLDDDLRNALHRLSNNAIRFNQDVPMLNAIAHHVRDYACGLYEEGLKKPFHLNDNSNTNDPNTNTTDGSAVTQQTSLGGASIDANGGISTTATATATATAAKNENETVLGMAPIPSDAECQRLLPVFFARLLHQRRQRWLLCHKEALHDDELDEVSVLVKKSKQAFEKRVKDQKGSQEEYMVMFRFFDSIVEAVAQLRSNVTSKTSTLVSGDGSITIGKDGGISWSGGIAGDKGHLCDSENDGRDVKDRLNVAVQSTLINLFGMAFNQHLYPHYLGTPSKNVNAQGTDLPAILSMMTLCRPQGIAGVNPKKESVYFSHCEKGRILTNMDSMLLRTNPDVPYTYPSSKASDRADDGKTKSAAIGVDYLPNFSPSPTCLLALQCLDEHMGMFLVSIEERLKRGNTHSTIWGRPLDCAIGALPNSTRKFPVLVLAGGAGTTVSKLASQTNLLRIPPNILSQLIKYGPGWTQATLNKSKATLNKPGVEGTDHGVDSENTTQTDTTAMETENDQSTASALKSSGKGKKSSTTPSNGLPISVPFPPDLLFPIPRGFYLTEFLDTREFGWMEAKSLRPYFGLFPTEAARKDGKAGLRSKLFDSYRWLQHNTLASPFTTDQVMQSLAPGEATAGDTCAEAMSSIERDIPLPTLNKLKSSIDIPEYILLKIEEAEKVAAIAAAAPVVQEKEKKPRSQKRKHSDGGRERREEESGPNDSLLEVLKLKVFRPSDHITPDFSCLRPSIDDPPAAAFVCGEGVVHTKKIDRSNPLFFLESKKRDQRMMVLQGQLKKLNDDLSEVETELEKLRPPPTATTFTAIPTTNSTSSASTTAGNASTSTVKGRTTINIGADGKIYSTTIA